MALSSVLMILKLINKIELIEKLYFKKFIKIYFSMAEIYMPEYMTT